MGIFDIFAGQGEKISIADFVSRKDKSGFGILSCKVEKDSIADFVMQWENSRVAYINGEGRNKYFDYFNGKGETRKRRRQFLRKVHATILDYCSNDSMLDVFINIEIHNKYMFIHSSDVVGFGIGPENIGEDHFSNNLYKAVNLTNLEYAPILKKEYQSLKSENYTYDDIFKKLQPHIVCLSIEAVKKFENEYSLPEAESLPCTVGR